MVVEGANDNRLAIECDGDAFHGPDRWEADMNRQRILERGVDILAMLRFILEHA
ncbi:TPA: hypothetical protein ACQT19_005993 [Pseudomonas aeruginosa]|uniref:hypothetical protein n=1 Tax=Pseudomonas aeruginosa TaxID=287 RepID=UPI001E5D6201|nr:hypothetical protein [Pseudomonas aeruginosa]